MLRDPGNSTDRLLRFASDFVARDGGMRIGPITGDGISIAGTLNFEASYDGHPTIHGTYSIRILVPLKFPRDLPKTFETGQLIPRDGHHHINPDDSLCLGSRLRLHWMIAKVPTIIGYVDYCVIPYLYGVGHKMNYGTFPFGELTHGSEGERADVARMLGISTDSDIAGVFTCLGQRRKTANHHPCPCGCGKRLGKCRFRVKIDALRPLASRECYQEIARSI